MKAENNSSWEKVPAIRVIVGKRVILGPGGIRWFQTDVRGPYWRIYWNDAPGAFVSVGGREVELTPDKVVALSPDTVYSTRAEKTVGHFYVHCFVAQPFSEIKGKMFVWENPELTRRASSLAEKANPCLEDWRAMMELLVYLNSVLLAIPPENAPDCPSYSTKVASAMEILGDNFKISNSELARRLGMSRNGFLALFKKETQTSPQAYSRQIRLNEACVMLHYCDKSIDEIARDTGFCDRYHFSRAFRSTIGLPPRQFRLRR